MMRFVAFTFVSASIVCASVASAQVITPTPISPFATQFQPIALDTLGAPPSAYSAFYVSTPLRLALQGSILRKAGSLSNCASREDAAGNSVRGIPVAFYGELRITPALALTGFSQLGCPIDGAVGGTLTVTIPIRQSIALVFGAGIIGAPGQVPLFGGVTPSLARGFSGLDSPINVAARADLVWKTKGGRSFSVGIGSMGRGRQGLTFGGGF